MGEGIILFYFMVAGFFTGGLAGVWFFRRFGCLASLLLGIVSGIFSSFALGWYVFPIIIGGVINPLIHKFHLNYKVVYQSLLAILIFIAIFVLSKLLITAFDEQLPQNSPNQKASDENKGTDSAEK